MLKRLFRFMSECGCSKWKPLDLHDTESIKKGSTQALVAVLRDGTICTYSANRVITELLDRLCKE